MRSNACVNSGCPCVNSGCPYLGKDAWRKLPRRNGVGLSQVFNAQLAFFWALVTILAPMHSNIIHVVTILAPMHMNIIQSIIHVCFQSVCARKFGKKRHFVPYRS